jgi:hypothetical protein
MTSSSALGVSPPAATGNTNSNRYRKNMYVTNYSTRTTATGPGTRGIHPDGMILLPVTNYVSAMMVVAHSGRFPVTILPNDIIHHLPSMQTGFAALDLSRVFHCSTFVRLRLCSSPLAALRPWSRLRAGPVSRANPSVASPIASPVTGLPLTRLP